MEHKWHPIGYSEIQCKDCGLTCDPRTGSPDHDMINTDCIGRDERPEVRRILDEA
jgi:hypothetical protein